MGGSSGGGGSRPATTPMTPANVMPQMATFGQSGISPNVMQQLSAGGLLNTAQPGGFYSEFQVPILRTPSDIDAYLRSTGRTPITAATVDNQSIVGSAGTPRVPVTPATGGGGSTPASRPSPSVTPRRADVDARDRIRRSRNG